MTKVDHGVTLKVRCPHCHDVACFRLIEERPLWTLFGSDTTAMWYLRCAGCTYPVPVTPAEIDEIQQLNRDAQRFESGEISGIALREKLARSRAPCISFLLAAAEIQPCSRCGEDVPPSFAVCWNCGEASRVSSVTATCEQPSVPSCTLDPVTGSSHPLIVHSHSDDSVH